MRHLFGEPALYGGMKVIVQQDYKQYSNNLSPIRRRGFTLARVIRRRRFTGWGNYLEDGQVIQDKVNNILVMNPRTKRQLDTALANS